MYTRDKRRETQTGGIEEERKREREVEEEKEKPGEGRTGEDGALYIRARKRQFLQAVGKKDRNKKVHEEPKLP